MDMQPTMNSTEVRFSVANFLPSTRSKPGRKPTKPTTIMIQPMLMPCHLSVIIRTASTAKSARAFFSRRLMGPSPAYCSSTQTRASTVLLGRMTSRSTTMDNTL